MCGGVRLRRKITQNFLHVHVILDLPSSQLQGECTFITEISNLVVIQSFRRTWHEHHVPLTAVVYCFDMSA